jgi:hypothetical protein
MRLATRKPAAAQTLEHELVDACRRQVCPLYGQPAFLEIGQRKTRGAGTTKGVVDVLVAYAGWLVMCEFKRPDGTGEVSRKQQEVAKWCWENGVDTVVIESVQQFSDVLNWLRRHPRPAVRLPWSLTEAMECQAP